MSSTPGFASTPVAGGGLLSAANPNRDGTGTIVTIYTAPAGGARIDDLFIKARSTTTAGVIRFYLHDGTNYYFLREVLVTAITPSATVAAFESQLTSLGMVLPNGWSLRASTEKAEPFNVTITRAGSF